jgi:hypothetical protein
MRISHRLFLSLLVMVVLGCARNQENPVGVSLPDDDWFGQGPFLDTLILEESLSVRVEESAGAAPFLLAGSEDGLVSRALVRFSSLPAADSVIVARLEVTLDDLIGTEELTLDVFLLTNAEWEESQVTWELRSGSEDEDSVFWESPGGDFDDSGPLASFSVTSTSIDSTLEVEIDPSLINAWIDSTTENAGLIIVPRFLDAGIAEFRSRQSPSDEENPAPHLFLEYMKSDESDSIVSGSILVGEDATIYYYEDLDVPPELYLRVGSVPQYRAFLRFSTDSLSQAATVRKANLELPIQGRVPPDRAFIVAALRITGDWDGVLTPLEFSPLDSVEVGSEGIAALDVTALVWGWVSQNIENDGVAVKASVERGRYGYADFAVGTAGEVPRCIIEYTLPPQEVKGPTRKEKARE